MTRPPVTCAVVDASSVVFHAILPLFSFPRLSLSSVSVCCLRVLLRSRINFVAFENARRCELSCEMGVAMLWITMLLYTLQ